jgi:phage-related protein
METFTTQPDFVYEEEIEYSTQVSDFENGYEQRRATWSAPLRLFRLFFRARTAAEFATVKAFVIARQGRFDSFTWNNPNDSTNYTVRFLEDKINFRQVSYDVYDFELKLQEVRA